MSDQPPLQPIHSLPLLRSPRYRSNYEYWLAQPTDAIVASLRPGHEESLKARPDGRVVQGNTRVTILVERGYDVNSLPREVLE